MTARYLTAARLNELAAQLGERDRAVVRRVFDLRFVSGGQLMRLHFADVPPRTAREALLRLTRLDVLARLPRSVGGVRAGSAGYVYRVGPAGQRVAALLGWQPAASKWHSHVPGTLFVAHALQVAELHAQLAEADRARRLELIELAAEVASRRRYGGPVGQRILKPDSYVRLGNGDYEFVYFIEVDMGTEGSRALEAKLRQYVEYEASGQEQERRGVFPLTVWLTPDAGRAEVIAGCVGRLPRSAQELFRVACFDEVLPLLTASGGSGELARP
jgi:protein involved in plasmid replication-relaxation